MSLSFLLLVLGSVSALASSISNITQELGSQLSAGASISAGSSAAPRWSAYDAPSPGYTITVIEASDVAKTIQYCSEKGVNFLAQSGAHSSPTTFHIGSNDVVINLAAINYTKVSDDGTTMAVGAGAMNSDIIQAAFESNGIVLSGGCNCVGVFLLEEGSVTSWAMPVDNLISLDIVLANGTMLTTTKTDYPDLFWALGGAGPNFGIVTSFTIKVHPKTESTLSMVNAELYFTGDKLEAYIDAVNNLNMTSLMVNEWGFGYQNSTPYIYSGIIYLDNDEAAAREAFKSLYDIGPAALSEGVLAYNHLNDQNDDFCTIDGLRKPSWHVGLKTLDYPTWQSVWDEMVSFVDQTGLNSTRVLVETYSPYLAREIGDQYVCYPHRAINFHAVFQSLYVDSSWDNAVEDLGSKIRTLWQSTDGFETHRTYINFAHGDEAPEIIYGESLPRLKELKAAWDPENRFDQWLPIM
ncbi:FAD-binding domain-containing protein [Xylariaceae sp. FL0255]|nr:FAD-binding domain-containing protein [Xylariaceae sp. FL0255]